jgi:hypothetical protein
LQSARAKLLSLILVMRQQPPLGLPRGINRRPTVPNGVNRLPPLYLPRRPTPPATDSRLLDSRAAAQYLGGISERTLRRITAPNGDLPCVRPTPDKRRVFYDLGDLEAYIERHKERPPKSAALFEAPANEAM